MPTFQAYQLTCLSPFTSTRFASKSENIRGLRHLALRVTFLSLALCMVVSTGCKKSETDAAFIDDVSDRVFDPTEFGGPLPSQDLAPDEVVRIQVEQLRQGNNEGIHAAFRFASPNNRSATGSAQQFISLMKTPSYRALVEAEMVEFFEIEVDQDVAKQVVSTIDEDGEISFYLFELSRQDDGDYAGCWLTDGLSRSRFRIRPSA